jgi:DNA helicase II / ATP-dependent DNA helicase PcrA
VANLDEVYAEDRRAEAFENHAAGLLVSLAGPGTGKTYCLLRRIRALTTGQGVRPQGICYITFIGAIADAFLADYEKEFGPQPDRSLRPRINTLHSFACRLLRNKGASLGYDEELFFADLSDGEAGDVFLKDLLLSPLPPGIRAIGPLRKAVKALKRAWRTQTDVRETSPCDGGVVYPLCALARSYRLLDWDQAVHVANELLAAGTNRPGWIGGIQHLLVDEYQDFNPVEQAFLAALQPEGGSIVIVGDDCQSIYGSRDAAPAGLSDLFHDPSADTVTLVLSRRCKTEVLEASNRLLGTISPTAPKLKPLAAGGRVECQYFGSSKAELAYLATYLRERLAEVPDPAEAKDGVVCLFPTKKALRFYLEKLGEELPCRASEASPNEQRIELTELLELVRNPHQRFAERRILERFPAIKPRHKRALVALVLAADQAPTWAIGKMLREGMDGSAATSAADYLALCEALSSRDCDTISRVIVGRLGADLGVLTEAISVLLREEDCANSEDLIEATCDRILPETAQPRADPKYVQFLTMHGSKGLTRHCVAMPRLGHIWRPGADSDALSEEDRRLFYVAMTRATDHVLVTYPLHRGAKDPLFYQTAERGETCPFVVASGLRAVYHN